MQETILVNTTLVPETEVSVVSELPGIAREIAVDEGDLVSESTRLLRITQPDVRFAIEEAELAFRQANEQLENLRPLLEDGLIARQVYDDIFYQRERAQLSLDRARAERRDTSIASPIAGTIIRRHIELGEAVVPNQTLFEIATLDRLEAIVAIPERELASLQLQQSAIITIGALNDITVPAHVSWIDPVVDPQAGTVRVRISLDPPNSEEERNSLRPGMFVSIHIITDVHRDALTLPKRALIYESNNAYVFVIRDPISPENPEDLPAFRIQRVQVELGLEQDSTVEVLSGVSQGERVIVIGHDGLDPDATVFVSENE